MNDYVITKKQLSYFVTFESLDFVGKGTQISLLKKYYKDKMSNRKVIFTREPGGTPISEKIRSLILDPENESMTARTEALLYSASRNQHVNQVIKPNLEKGNIVISDRYVHSSYVYQGIARALGYDEIVNLNEFATEGIMPDITFVLMLEFDKWLERKATRKSLDRIEKEDVAFFKSIHEGFETLTKEKNIYYIDANGTPEEIHEKIVEILETKMNEKYGLLAV